VRCALLGPLEIVDDSGRWCPVSGARQRVLLAALALHANEPVSQDALAELVWDGAPPPGHAATLRSHMKRLRQALGPQGARIITRAPGYLIELGEEELDLAAFEILCREAGAALRAAAWEKAAHAAQRALGLWRGEPLADVPSQALRDAHVPRLDQLLAQAHEDHVEAQLRLGRHEQVLQALRDLSARYPLRERFRAQYVLALAGVGRRAEALAAYQDARKALAGELGIEPGPELRAAQERVLAADGPSALSPPESAARGGAAPYVPWRLPSAALHFTGRAGELDGLIGAARQARSADGAAVCAIDGAAGIGKTALAVHAAHRLAERFPDGQLFLDLRGDPAGSEPRTAGEALEALLRALGVPAGQIPDDARERAALYRRHLAGTRTLILLDDAATEAQVRPLLPGAGGCLAMVTSRRRLSGLDGAHRLSLGPLPPKDAVALLRAVAGPVHVPRGDPHSGELAQLCGCAPLALRIAGSLLGRHRASGLAHVAGLLRDRRRRAANLPGEERDLNPAFDAAYAGLPERHRLLLRRLGLVPGPDVEAYAAAALLDLDPNAAAGMLEDLADRNLLIAHAPDRYRLHGLVRARARDLAAAGSDHAAVLQRLLRYYAYTAQSASACAARHLRPGPGGPAPEHVPALSDPDAARTWLRAERENLQAAYAHARTSALHGHAVDLAVGLGEILLCDGPWALALDVQQAAAQSAGNHDRPAAQATALADLGWARYLAGDYSEAEDALTRALEIYRALGERRGEAYALTRLGRTRTLAGDYSGSAGSLTGALEIYRALGHRDGQATALADLGRVRYLTADYAGSRDTLTRALELSRVLGHRDGEATALADLGRVRYLTADYAGSADALTGALEIYRALGHRDGEAAALIDLGRVRYLTGDYPGSGDACVGALEIYRALGNRRGEAYALTELGRTRALSGDRPGSGDAYLCAVEIYRALGSRGDEAWALTHYAATLAATGDRHRAFELYRQALAMNRELKKFDDQAVTLESLGECHLANGETGDAIAHLQQALEMYRRLGMAPDTDRVRTRLAALTAR
jgi:DNA-binding SARP family transcriptional activator